MKRLRPLPNAALIATASVLSSFIASGDDTPIELETLEVTAHPTGADERAAACWVLRPDDDVAPTAVADLLAAVPGVHLDRAGGAGGKSTLYLRGGEENHTLVLLDGVPLNDPTNSRGGGVDFSLVEPSALASAAIVRGPGSMRHGPDAISGVIHFDTTSQATAGHRAALEAGGDGLLRARWRSTLAASACDRVTLGGAHHAEEAADGAGDLRRFFAHGGWRHDGRVGVVVHAWHLDQESRAFPDDSGGVRHAILRTLERRDDRQTAASLQLGQRDTEGAWSFTADAARLRSRVVSPGVAPGLRDPAGLPGMRDDIRLDRLRAALLAERRVGDWLMSGGLDAAREDGRDAALIDFGPFQVPASFAARRDRVGGFIEGTGPLTDAITLAAGLRGDRYDDAGTHATGRIGLLGWINADTQWRVNAGTGFKPPSFYALAHPLVGDPDLRPERGRSLDLGLRHTFAGDRALIDLTLFAHDLRDGVDFDPGPPPRVANIAEIRGRGAELAALWRASRTLSLGAAASYTDITSRPDGARMRGRPHWRGSLSLAWTPLAPLSLDARVTGVDAVPSSSIPTGDVRLPGWVRLDLAARWALDERWSVSLACDNALGSGYAEVAGFTAPGRRVRAGVQVAF